MIKVKYDEETSKWFNAHVGAETTVCQCLKCGLFYKESLGHKCGGVPEFNLREWLKDTYKVSLPSFELFNEPEVRLLEVRPRIMCDDGFNMSVQASYYHYCSPRYSLSSGMYDEVEVGFPSNKEEMLMPYIECSGDEPTKAVYPYVPVDVVEKIIRKHGGIKEVFNAN